MSLHLPLKRMLAIGVFLCVVPIFSSLEAAGLEKLKIGVVDFQKVLNNSEAGQRSRKILLASKEQKESELKAIGEKLKKEREELKNNILLTEAAKAKKQAELREKEINWRNDYKAGERELQRKQIKASESIFSEVQIVINLISKEDKFDLIIEQTTARTILYSRSKLINITDKVINRYNNIK